MTTQEKINQLISIIRQKNSDLHLKNEQIGELHKLLRNLYASMSWRLTSPLRKMHAILVNSPVTEYQMPLTDDTSRTFADEDLAELTTVTPEVAATVHIPPTREFSEKRETVLQPGNLERETMLDIFVFPIIDWEFRFQRPQQIALRLARMGNRVFYFKTVFTRYKDHLTDENLVVKQLDDNIFQVTLATKDPLNIYRDMVHGRQPEADLLSSIAVLKKKYAIRHTVSIIDHPFWWPVARRLKNNINVYDCMDDHSGFSNNNNITTYEPGLTAESDLVVVSSDVLFSIVSQLSKNVIHVKNGTDFAHFSALPATSLLSHLTGPVIGYYGAIAEWFDTGLIEACAARYPEYQFVLIGKVTNTEIPRLSTKTNVHLLGEIPYAELPGYLKFFDVCMIPFKLTKLIEATNPVKFYEYISSGKPVVSVALTELLPYRDLCYISSNTEDFIANIGKALQEKGMEQKRIELARNNSWDVRVEAFYAGILALYPSVSIIMVTYNNLPFTRACLESIRKYTRYPNYEIIIIDNNSTDGTPGYLTQLAGEAGNIRILLNKENHGFARANNQGVGIAAGEYVVFLNNDTIVTNNWLESLLNHMTRDRNIGIICPETNEIGNEACIRVDYQEIGSLQEFAFLHTEPHPGSNFRIRCVPLFCAMIRTDLIREIGGLNEVYGIGMFEDDDLSESIKSRDYKVICAEDVFVHHFGRVSFKQIPTQEYQDLFRRNKEIYEKKWGKWVLHIRGWFNPPFTLPENNN